MSADDVTDFANMAAAAVGGLWAVGRFVLAVCDALDERWPWLQRITHPLGKFLGGAKARY